MLNKTFKIKRKQFSIKKSRIQKKKMNECKLPKNIRNEYVWPISTDCDTKYIKKR